MSEESPGQRRVREAREARRARNSGGNDGGYDGPNITRPTRGDDTPYTGPQIDRGTSYGGGGYNGPGGNGGNGGNGGGGFDLGDIRGVLRDARGISREVGGLSRDSARAWGSVRSWGDQSDTVYYRNATRAGNAEIRYNRTQERLGEQRGAQGYAVQGGYVQQGPGGQLPGYGQGGQWWLNGQQDRPYGGQTQPLILAPQPPPPAVAAQPTVQPTGTGAAGQPTGADATVQPTGAGAPVQPTGTGAAAQPTGTGATATGAPAADAPAADQPAPSLTAATGARAGRFGVRAQRAPRANEIPVIAQNQVEALQDMLIAKHGANAVGSMGSDGKYGPNTHAAVRAHAASLTPPITDLTTLDFTNPQDPETARFMAALQPQRAAAPAQPAGPTPEQLAQQQRETAAAAARAAEEQRLAAVEASIPSAVRGSQFDPRNIERLDPQQRYDLARHALHGIDELASENSRPNMERMYDKMDESVRWVNENLGMNIPRPSPADPLSNSAMYALGLRAAHEGRLSNSRNEFVTLPENMTQAQMNAAAVQYIRALDRSVDREDPSRAIRRFEERDMGRSGIEVDGLADPQMLNALRQAVAVRNGLAVVRGPEAPPAPPAQPAALLPASVTGGADVGGRPPEGPPGGPSVASVDQGRPRT